MERNILVSVIVPVYNVEEYLMKCLDSLVNQTFKEIEIIVVNDGSTDGSKLILNNYLLQYPEIVKVYHTDNHGQSAARNFAVQKAAGRYLAFCDADDYMEHNALEKMYEVVDNNKCDLVYCASYRIRDNEKYILGELSSPVSKESMILEATPFTFWSLLVEKDLMLNSGQIPEIIYEDVAYIPNLMSNAVKIGYCPTPVYNWVDRKDSTIHNTKDEKILDFITASNIAIQNIDSKYREHIVMNLAVKTLDKAKSMWFYGDKFLDFFKNLTLEIEQNTIYLNNPNTYQEIAYYIKLVNDPLMEKVIYIDGFSSELTVENLDMIKNTGFRDNAKVIILDEKNCDLNENQFVKQMYIEKKPEMVAGYFGIKRVYENGGIFLGSHMKVNGPFDCMIYYPAFFGYLSENQFSEKVFGGKKGNSVLGALLRTFQDLPYDVDISIRMKKVLTEQFFVKMNGRTTYSKYPFVLLSPLAVLTPVEGLGINLCECSKFDLNNDKLFTLPKETLASIANYPVSWQSGKIRNFKFKYKEGIKNNKELQKINKNISKRLNTILSSEEYQFSVFLRKKKWAKLFMRIYLLCHKKR
ncbi:glycosyltransferase family 2 protein [Robinsoniella peoriensis]|uniref:glycosyltransferase family 2 protein n=1 Tax=Robinsoniella peoriensis TaxID=180332 RepID=UPI00085C4920|nr:glycosyltransferase family 2 protein [Robinsoniella peoriensis]